MNLLPAGLLWTLKLFSCAGCNCKATAYQSTNQFQTIKRGALYRSDSSYQYHRTLHHGKGILSLSTARVVEHVAPDSENVSHNFWGTAHTEEEIISHVSNVLLSFNENEPQYDRVRILSAEPPLVVIHNFIPLSMCNDIINSAIEQSDLTRSTMGAEKEESTLRTSENTWLKESDCEVPLRTLADQVSRLSGVPPHHMENLQVVRYRPDQKFDLHTDHLDSFNDLECRGRLATCLVYLNSVSSSDYVDTASPFGSFTGGGTSFPEFNKTVSPTTGSAVFFWNTKERPGSLGYFDEMRLTSNDKLRHAGDPVLSGEKWACNRWIHPIPLGTGVRGL